MLASGAGLATLLAILPLPSQQVEGTAARGGLYSGPMASVQSSRGWRVVVGLLFHLCLQSTLYSNSFVSFRPLEFSLLVWPGPLCSVNHSPCWRHAEGWEGPSGYCMAQ